MISKISKHCSEIFIAVVIDTHVATLSQYGPTDEDNTLTIMSVEIPDKHAFILAWDVLSNLQ
jgi:hypothetical protein